MKLLLNVHGTPDEIIAKLDALLNIRKPRWRTGLEKSSMNTQHKRRRNRVAVVQRWRSYFQCAGI